MSFQTTFEGKYHSRRAPDRFHDIATKLAATVLTIVQEVLGVHVNHNQWDRPQVGQCGIYVSEFSFSCSFSDEIKIRITGYGAPHASFFEFEHGDNFICSGTLTSDLEFVMDKIVDLVLQRIINRSARQC